MALELPVKIPKFGGLNNAAQDPVLAGRTDLQVALNVDANDAGGLSNRPGGVRVYPGVCHSVMTDGSDLLFREGTELKRLDTVTGVAEVLRGGFTAGLELTWIHLNNAIYFMDGEVAGVYQDRRARSYGLTPPPAPSLSSASGNILNGRIQVVTTYLRNDGQESGASPDSWITTTQGGLRVTVTASSDPDVVGIVIYCSTPDGKLLFKQGVVTNQDGSTTITSRILVGAGLECKHLNLQTPIPGTLIDFYRGLMLIGGGSMMQHSQPWSYELMNPDRNLVLFPGDMTMMIALENGIWVGTTRGTQFLYGKDPLAAGGWEVRSRLSTFPPLRAAQRTDSTNFSPNLRLAPGQVAVWPTPEGIMVGDGEGTYRNLTGDRWVAPDGPSGTGFINKSAVGGTQYLFGIMGTPGQGSGNVRVTINP